MAIAKELELRLPNSPGALAEVCLALAGEHVNILAMTLDSAGRLRLVVDNHVRAAGALSERRHSVATRDVIVLTVSHAPGSLSPVAALAADAGLNLEYAYTGASDNGRCAMVVLGVDDVQRAAALAGL